VLIPLAEIAPDLFHPRLHQTIQQLKTLVDASSIKLVQTVNP
jgi:7,8-dihydro-6-hydroxymethylpterin-pyrophosphokinase